MQTTKICPVCLKQFTACRNAVKFCSDDCKQQHKALSKKKKCICKWCNRPFYTNRKKTYCSEKCRLFANARISEPEDMPKVIHKPKLSLSEVALLARNSGMTYGKYVHQFGL